MRSALLLLVLTAITVIHCTEEHWLKQKYHNIPYHWLDEYLPEITHLNKDNINEHPPVDGAQFGKNGTWFVKALDPYEMKPQFYVAGLWMLKHWAKAGQVRNQ